MVRSQMAVALYTLMSAQTNQAAVREVAIRLDAHLIEYREEKSELNDNTALLLEKIEDLQQHVAHIEGMLERELAK